MHGLRRRVLPLAAACAIFASAGATAGAEQNAGQLTATEQESSFTSPSGNYGPWQIQTLQYQFQTGADIPSVTLFHRNDDDRPTSSHSSAVYADDYHTFSDRFYAYAQASLANGTIQPYRSFYLEADAKLLPSKNFVIAAGGAETQNPDGSSTRYLSVGPTLYEGPMSYEVRFLPANTNGISTSAAEFVAMYSDIGRNQVSLTFLNGSQPSVLVGFPAQFTTYQRLNETDLMWKHWFRRDFGVEVGGTFGNHFDRASGASIYKQRALTVGIFVGRAVGLPR